MKKPRTVKNKSVKLSCNEDAKGKRSIDITVRNGRMAPSQARTVCDSLKGMINWCNA